MATHYNDRQGSVSEEFYDDINRIKYIKRLISKYIDSGKLKSRLLMNHLVVLINVFGSFPCTRILMHKIDPKHHEIIITLLDELKALTPKFKSLTTIDSKVRAIIREELK